MASSKRGYRGFDRSQGDLQVICPTEADPISLEGPMARLGTQQWEHSSVGPVPSSLGRRPPSGSSCAQDATTGDGEAWAQLIGGLLFD